jgi:hypothetical protein
MCLITDRGKWMVADDDIVCYKVLRLNRKNNHFYTPFRNTLVSDAIVEGKREFVADGIAEFMPHAHDNLGIPVGYSVGVGAIHTYANREVAKSHIGPNETVRKCVIPKGTEFVYGHDNFRYEGFAAKKIKFVNE